MGRDYIVVYEEPLEDDPVDDELVVDVGVGHTPRNVEAEFGAAITNEAGVAATIGLIGTIVGGVLAIITAVLFALNYPDAWWDQPPETGMTQLVLVLSLVSVLLLLLGTLMVGFGRNLRARGVLHSLRFR